MITKPAVARQKVTFVSENNTDIFKVVATAACEVISIHVTAGGAACTFRVVDANNFTPGSPIPSYNLESGISQAAESSNSSSYDPNQPIPYLKGVVIVCEQGEGSNAECTILLNRN